MTIGIASLYRDEQCAWTCLAGIAGYTCDLQLSATVEYTCSCILYDAFKSHFLGSFSLNLGSFTYT